MTTDPVGILVVDDLAEQRLSIEVALAELGEHVVSVSSGRDALRSTCSTTMSRVILLDVNMPEMDGFETASLIRRRPRNANTPIIFLTADHDAMQASRGTRSAPSTTLRVRSSPTCCAPRSACSSR